jgi:hypothetical protein
MRINPIWQSCELTSSRQACTRRVSRGVEARGYRRTMLITDNRAEFQLLAGESKPSPSRVCLVVMESSGH